MFERNLYSGRVREIFENLRNTYGKNVPIFNSYLRQALPLSNNQASYKFNIVQQGGGNVPLPNQLLSSPNGFYAYAFGVFLSRTVIAKPGNAPLQTYPNPTLFADSPDLEVVYNGILQARINQTVVIQQQSLQLCRVVDTTLQSSSNALSERHPSDGFIELEPNLRLAGTQNIEFEIQIPTFQGIDIEANTSGERNDLVIQLLGFNIPNGSAYFAPFYEQNQRN